MNNIPQHLLAIPAQLIHCCAALAPSDLLFHPFRIDELKIINRILAILPAWALSLRDVNYGGGLLLLLSDWRVCHGCKTGRSDNIHSSAVNEIPSLL